MKHRSIARWLAAGLTAVALSCVGNQAGNLGSKKMGDTSNPAQRGSPTDELRAACGSGELTPAGEAVVRRQPYLQQVTTTSAKIGWVSTRPNGEHVEVTLPDANPHGAPVIGEREAVTVRRAGENQKWAVVSGLAPGTVYCYALVDGGERLSERIGFRTAPAADSAEPVRFLAFGDSGGGGDDQRALAEQMYMYPYDLIVHTGDIAYDSGTIGEFEDTVFAMYAPLFRHVPFFPAAGNHEYKTMKGAPFRAVFSLPGGNGEKWYSFDWGRVHFVALDTEADYATQARWLDKDLAATDRPWKIVYLHKPPYSTGTHGSDTALRAALEPVLVKHGVQLVLAGHDHNYERMSPQKGVYHVVTGGGGVGTRPVGESSFTAFSEDVIHFVYGEVGEDELVLHAIDATGTEFDSVVIPRTPR